MCKVHISRFHPRLAYALVSLMRSSQFKVRAHLSIGSKKKINEKHVFIEVNVLW